MKEFLPIIFIFGFIYFLILVVFKEPDQPLFEDDRHYLPERRVLYRFTGQDTELDAWELSLMIPIEVRLNLKGLIMPVFLLNS